MRTKHRFGRWRTFAITDRHGVTIAVVAVTRVLHDAPGSGRVGNPDAPPHADVDRRPT
jgi:hypothetical protein